jgi:hypothetical protein
MSPEITIDYINWRGERRKRQIVVCEFVFGTMMPWHPKPGWMVRAIDVEKGEERLFALTGIKEWIE